MQARSKVVELSGQRFEVRRLPPEVGSFIFMRMLGVSMRSAANEEEKTTKSVDKEETAPIVEITGEMRVRALSFGVFSGGISFEDFRFIQAACMKVIGVSSQRAGMEFFMPIMADNGLWTSDGEDVSTDIGLVTRLTTEVLVFCFADFFAESSPGL